jgi:hypothetical protein
MTQLTQLFMASGGLSGTIPTQLYVRTGDFASSMWPERKDSLGLFCFRALLNNLTYFDLASHSLTGTIPTELQVSIFILPPRSPPII